jgi:Family of unknown function (DUF6492)
LKDIVLYCKSYRRDFLRVRRLLESIEKFNLDQIPVYISTPQDQYEDLVAILGSVAKYCWVSDESIVAANPKAPLGIERSLSGSLSQQIIKSEFWRLKISENYLCIDSDCLFIRDFHKGDFLTEQGFPYTVLHQNKEYLQFASNLGKSKVQRDLIAEAKRVQSLFNRRGPVYYCAPSPFIWSASVWKSLDENYLLPVGISIWELIDAEHPESLIYGEALLKFKATPLMAIEPLFRVYHYDWQYLIMKRFGESVDKLRDNYMGVIYQSNWDKKLDFGSLKVMNASYMLKKIKYFLRYIYSWTR